MVTQSMDFKMHILSFIGSMLLDHLFILINKNHAYFNLCITPWIQFWFFPKHASLVLLWLFWVLISKKSNDQFWDDWVFFIFSKIPFLYWIFHQILNMFHHKIKKLYFDIYFMKYSPLCSITQFYLFIHSLKTFLNLTISQMNLHIFQQLFDLF